MADGTGNYSSEEALRRAIQNLKYYADQTKADKVHTHTDEQILMSNSKTLKQMLNDGSLQGTSAYVHIKWKSSETSTTLLNTPNAYIGIVSTNSATAPTTVNGYSWYKYKGEDGIIGTQFYFGTSAPPASTGRIGDWYINTATFQLYRKTSESAWTAQGTSFRGSKILTGTGNPQSSAGSIDDIYIDTTANGNYNFYQKGSSGWASKGSLKGADGVIGKDGDPGSQILSSELDPVASTGRIGDWHINRNTFDIFEKTTENTWTNRGNLRGKDNIGGGIVYDGHVIVAPIFATIDETTGAMTFDPDGNYLLSQDIDGNIVFREYFMRAPTSTS